ncbi:HNH endonuclease [Bradyrhizobium sp.]
MIDRFEQKFIPEPNSGCWLWTAATDEHGYGRFRIGSKIDGTRRTAIAPRVSWSIYKGKIPEATNVLHSCDNPYCVNPDHLFLGTQNDNMKDCSAKGRTSKGDRHSLIQKSHIPTGKDHWRYGQPGNNPGEKHWAARLSADDVRAIRADARTCEQIAKEYQVSFQQVARIKNRERWAHVK